MLQDESLWTPEVSTVGGAVSAEMWISERVGQYQVRFIRSRRLGQVWLLRDIQSANHSVRFHECYRWRDSD